MSENQLTVVPDPAAQDAVVVDRFATASRDIVPGVQVSLAKRVICPGSDRVLCLAAHTSVPMNDDELASVSDLALKLSDGTNVRLSLSFFNDSVANDIVMPLPRPNFARAGSFSRAASFYDPDRYRSYKEGSNDSKLGPVLFAMSVIAAASMTLAVFGPISNYIHIGKNADRDKQPQTAPIARTALLPLAVPMVVKAPVTTHEIAAKHPAPPAKPKHHRTYSTATVAPHGSSGSAHEPSSMLLVPPPPPFAPSTVLFAQPPMAPAKIAPAKVAEVKPARSAVTSNIKRGADAPPPPPSTKVVKQLPAAANSDAPPVAPRAASNAAVHDSLRALQDQMMLPMYAYARGSEPVKQPQARQSERAQAADQTVENTFSSNVDPAMHTAPLPGGDDTQE
ncbi:MAG TPA: hypothetical protein V6C81_25095 [Planktothrix sp.]|jgi:hypothetical protein